MTEGARRDNTARRPAYDNKPERQTAECARKRSLFAGPEPDVEDSLSAVLKYGSGSLPGLAQTTTDLVRLGGTTTGRSLAKRNDHRKSVAYLASAGKNRPCLALPQAE